MSIVNEGTIVQESGDNVRGLRSIYFDLGFHPGTDGVIRFPDKWDIKADLSTIDQVEFFLSHLNLTNVDTSNIEFRMKSGGANYYKVLVDMQTTNWLKHTFRPIDFTTVGSPNWNNINCVEFFIPESGGSIIFSDNFDDGDLAGWTLVQGSGTITASSSESVSGSYSMRLEDIANDSYAHAYKLFGAQTGVIYIDCAIKPTWVSGEAIGTIQVGDNADDLDIAVVEFASNRFIWANDGSFNNMVSSGISWKMGEWHFIRIKITTATSKWDLYINDFSTPVLTNLDFREAATDVGGVHLYTWTTGQENKNRSVYFVDEVFVGKNPISGIIQLDGFVARKKEVYAIAENIESQKLWKVRELPLLDKDVIETDTAKVLVDTILRNTQYPTFRVSGTIPLMQNNLLGRNYYVMIKGMKWLLPVNEIQARLTPYAEILTVSMGKRPPDVQEILDGFGIEQGRISIGGSGADFGAIIEQFEKACFQTCETTCQGCAYGGSCESSCLKTGCLTDCMVSLCMTTCQSIVDRYNNWCSEGTGCQTCSESPYGII